VSQFLASITFADSKRPITKGVLERVNLNAVYEQVKIDQLTNCASESFGASVNFDRTNVAKQLQLFEDGK
jgi:hypothetical protein